MEHSRKASWGFLGEFILSEVEGPLHGSLEMTKEEDLLLMGNFIRVQLPNPFRAPCH